MDHFEIQEAQRTLCSRFGAAFISTPPDDKIGFAQSTMGLRPIDGLRVLAKMDEIVARNVSPSRNHVGMRRLRAYHRLTVNYYLINSRARSSSGVRITTDKSASVY
jgi:hypothetical protein